jgi:hypothetical protein
MNAEELRLLLLLKAAEIAAREKLKREKRRANGEA